MPTLNPEIFNLQLAAESQTYCKGIKATLAQFGSEISELSTHIQGQLIAVHPAYDLLMVQFAPDAVQIGKNKTKMGLYYVHHIDENTRFKIMRTKI